MPTIGTCALCKTPDSALQGSHIVPEFFYKRVYTKSHKFTAISLVQDERLTIEQKGYREDLLCQKCETKLSKWETVLSQFVTAVISDNYTHFRRTQYLSATIVDGVNYSRADSNLKCNTCHQVRFADVITSFVLVIPATSA